MFFLIVLVLFMPKTKALGVTPGRITLNYDDSLNEQVFSFKILNTENKAVQLFFSVEGDLNNSIILHKNKIKLLPNEKANINYSLNIDENYLKAGPNKARIIIRQYQNDDEVSSFSALPAVSFEIVINTPYPGKYIESDIKILGTEKNKTTKFLIPVVNKGEEDIGLIKADINISSKGKQIAFIETNSGSLESMTRKDLYAEWLANVPMGVYLATVDLIYDDEIATYYKTFNIGEADLDIFDIFVEDFELGNIVELNILVENRWNEDLKEVYANLVLYDSFGNKVVDIKSAPYDIPALRNLRILLYWDTTGIEKGKYTGKVRIISKKNIRERKLYVEIRNTGIGLELESGGFVFGRNRNYFLTFITAVLILGLIALIIILINPPKKLKKLEIYRYFPTSKNL